MQWIVYNFYPEKFCNSSDPTYSIKEIDDVTLENARQKDSLNAYDNTKESSTFQVILFTPNSKTIKAAPYLCSCKLCLESYGSCKLFTEYSLTKHMLNKRSMRSNFSKRCETEDQDIVDEMHITLSSFIEIGSICAIAANDASFDTVFFVHILSDEVEAEDIITDDFNHQISTKQIYYKCHYLEKSVEGSKGYTYFENRKKVVFVYKEAIVYIHL